MKEAETILRGRHFATGAVCDFHIADGVILGISEPGRRITYGSNDLWIAPGLLDIQVNGFRGHDFCSAEVSIEDVAAVTCAMTEAGVTGYCPTVTTNSPESMLASVRAIAHACDSMPNIRERVLGLHIEGPYISPLDGPRGAHSPAFVRDPDWAEFCGFQEAAGGRIRLVTLAPELPGALEFIAKATTAGVVVSIGHHAASGEQIAAAVDAGARLCTHLGNGAHAALPRHPNYLWHQLADDRLMASIIADGHHLPPEVVKCYLRIKGAGRLILISDVISPAGQPAGDYEHMGVQVRVDAHGPVRLRGTPYLAGSATRLAEDVHNLQRFTGASFAESIAMASYNPAHLFGLDETRGTLQPGARADLALFRDDDQGRTLVGVVLGGQPHSTPEVWRDGDWTSRHQAALRGNDAQAFDM